MRADPRLSIFKMNYRVDSPAAQYVALADRLEGEGFLKVNRREFVRCVSPYDCDFPTGRSCNGLIYIEEDERNTRHFCPECGREVPTLIKEKTKTIKVAPVEDALLVELRKLLSLGAEIREDPRGLFRLSGDSGEVHVAFVDFCYEQAVFQMGYTRHNSLVYVVANGRDFTRYLPADVPVFYMLDLLDGDTTEAFQREVRRLLRPEDPAMRLPAVYRMQPNAFPHAGLVPPGSHKQPVAPNPYPDVVRIQTPDGARWSDVSIHLVDGETVAIRAGGKMQRYGHIQLGLADKRNGRPTKLWSLLETLCEERGHISLHRSAESFSTFKVRVSRLRPLLQHIFGIYSDPFTECSRYAGLRAAFNAYPDTDNSSMPAIVSEWIPTTEQ